MAEFEATTLLTQGEMRSIDKHEHSRRSRQQDLVTVTGLAWINRSTVVVHFAHRTPLCSLRK